MKLDQLLTRDRVAVNLPATDWRDAICQIGALMVRSGAVEPRYIDAMIRTAEELGPYIVIAPGIAMPHARPEEGVVSPCIALATLGAPINFGNPDNDPVHLILAFGVVDNRQHIEALSEIATIFSNHFEKYGDIRELLSAGSADELLTAMLSTANCPQPAVRNGLPAADQEVPSDTR